MSDMRRWAPAVHATGRQRRELIPAPRAFVASLWAATWFAGAALYLSTIPACGLSAELWRDAVRPMSVVAVWVVVVASVGVSWLFVWLAMRCTSGWRYARLSAVVSAVGFAAASWVLPVLIVNFVISDYAVGGCDTPITGPLLTYWLVGLAWGLAAPALLLVAVGIRERAGDVHGRT